MRGIKAISAIAVLLLTGILMPSASAAGIQLLNDTALGDSIAFGLFAPIGRGYVPLYANHLLTDLRLPVALYPLGIPGFTSSDLLSTLRSSILVRLFVFSSEVVTWNIGGNDLSSARSSYKARTCGGTDNQECMRNAVQAFKSNWDGIISEILRLRRLRPTIIRTMDIYNPFVNEDKASDTWPGDAGSDFQVLKPYLDEVNAYIASTATAHNIAYARVYLAFNGETGGDDPSDKGLLSFDHFHPSAAGHVLIARLLRELGYLPMVP
jgi:lysophospholipase L1-like esterase